MHHVTLLAFPPGARRSIALRALDLLSSDELPEVALELLELPGSPSAAALAGATAADDARERAELFHRALSELGLQLPSMLEAARYLVVQVAREAVRGDLPRREAAELIRDIHNVVEFDLPRGEHAGAALEVAEVIGLYYSFHDTRSAAAEAQLDRELLDAFATIVARDVETA